MIVSWLNKKVLQIKGYKFKVCWDYKLTQSEFRWQKTLLPYGWDVWNPIEVKYNRKRMTSMYTFEVYKKKNYVNRNTIG
jgi:predicted type IV restriction endonuclease